MKINYHCFILSIFIHIYKGKGGLAAAKKAEKVGISAYSHPIRLTEAQVFKHKFLNKMIEDKIIPQKI